jgi:hypothetical protein
MIKQNYKIDKRSILEQHKFSSFNKKNETYAIVEWVSPDDKYVIFLDELIDVKNKRIIGNILEDYNNLKFFLEYSYNVSKNIPKVVKEGLIKEVRSLVLTENISTFKKQINETVSFTKQNKKILLEAENEGGGLLNKFGNWLGNEYNKTVSGVTDFANTVATGAKDLGSAVANFDWAKIKDILSKGVLYIARSIRSAMYSVAGGIVDAILVATGIGKAVQWIPWFIIVMLDFYEIYTGEYEDPNVPEWLRYVTIGIDCIGLFTTGAAAIAAKKTFGTVAAITKNPESVGFLQKIIGYFGNLPGKISEGMSILKNKSPKIYSFFAPIVSGISNFIQRAVTVLGNIVTKKTGNVAKNVGAEVGVNFAADTVTNQDNSRMVPVATANQIDYMVNQLKTDPFFN